MPSTVHIDARALTILQVAPRLIGASVPFTAPVRVCDDAIHVRLPDAQAAALRGKTRAGELFAQALVQLYAQEPVP